MPEPLKLVPFSSLAEVNPETKIPLRGKCSFLGMSDVTEDGRVADSHVRPVGDSQGYTHFCDRDVLFAKITPCMENGKGALVDNLHSGFGFGSTEFHVLRARESSYSGFIAHWAQSRSLRQRAEAFMVGSAGQRRVPTEFFSRFQVPLFFREEQRRISGILDAVDESVHVAGEVIAKREGVRDGVIDGLFSGRSSWSQGLLGSYLSALPRNGHSPSEVDEWTGVQVLGLGCLTNDGFVPRQLKSISPGYAKFSSAILKDGDLLISRANTRDLVGLVGRYKDVGGPCIYPDLMMRLSPNCKITPDFMERSLRHPYVRRQIMAHAVGTSESMVKISSAIVRNLRISVPSLEEQRRIVSVIEAHDERIAAERARLEKLRKLKAGLMDDLLTGRVRADQLKDLPV